eukprot:8731066-Ditylum_brightwellii.AAC.1
MSHFCQRSPELLPHAHALENNAPTSASAAEATMLCMTLHRSWMGLLRRTLPVGGFCGFLEAALRKKCPPALLQPSGAVKYEASEWTCRIMAQ